MWGGEEDKIKSQTNRSIQEQWKILALAHCSFAGLTYFMFFHLSDLRSFVNFQLNPDGAAFLVGCNETIARQINKWEQHLTNNIQHLP